MTVESTRFTHTGAVCEMSVSSATNSVSDQESLSMYVTVTERDIDKATFMKELRYGFDTNGNVAEGEITTEQRMVIIEWLAEICFVNAQNLEVLLCGIDFFDLAYGRLRESVTLMNVQEFSCACMLLSGKLTAEQTEDFSIPLAVLVKLSDGAATANGIVEWERRILQSLNFNMCYPSATLFIHRNIPFQTDKYDTAHAAYEMTMLAVYEPGLLKQHSYYELANMFSGETEIPPGVNECLNRIRSTVSKETIEYVKCHVRRLWGVFHRQKRKCIQLPDDVVPGPEKRLRNSR